MKNNITLSFGEYLRELRIKRDISMRKLAKELKMDVGNLSKIENSKHRPPLKEQFIDEINEILNLTQEEKQKLIDMASHENSEYPRDIKDELKGYNYIPMLLRTISNKKLTDGQIRDLARKLNK